MTDSLSQWRAIARDDNHVADEFWDEVEPVGSSAWPRRLLIGLLSLIAILAIGAATARLFVVGIYWLPTDSMAPTLNANDRVVINRLDTTVSRGDIVVHRATDTGAPIVRRVVALGGETVAVEDGTLVIDGVPLDEPYLDPATVNDDFDAIHVQEGAVFLLGDNRQVAHDSRVSGPVALDDIVGVMVGHF